MGLSAESCSHTARGRRRATLTRGPQPSAKERKEREERGAPPGPRRKWAACGVGGEKEWAEEERKPRGKRGRLGCGEKPGKPFLLFLFFFFKTFSK